MSAVPTLNWNSREQVLDYGALFAYSPLAVARCLPDGSLVPLNAAMEFVLAESWDTHSSLTLADLVAASGQQAFQRKLEELRGGLRESLQIELLASRTKNRFICTLWRVPVSAGGWDLIAALQDCTRAPAKENHLQSARLENVGRMVGGVAHDFNNWVTGVLLQCDLLRNSLEASHPARRNAEEIREACLGATGFVRQLLALTKPRSAEPRLLSLNDTVRSMRMMLDRLIGEKITLTFDLDHKLRPIRIDPTQLQQILMNLVLNARDAMACGGEIRVTTSESQLQIINSAGKPAFPCALLSVEDNGAGMDDEIRSHVFEPFYTTKASSGTGLGLATVHEIVTSNGGLIHVDSAPGRGTRFTVLLPVAVPARPNDFYPQQGEVPSSTKEES